MDSQRQHDTWVLVPRTEAKGKCGISCKWVYALKRDKTRRVKRYKARLGIRGLLQRMGIDYSETYASVIRFETIRMAFLYGELDAVVLMEQLPGFGENLPHSICRPKKRLHGLKQASRVWNQTLHKFLTTIGLERLNSDYGLYARKVGGEVTMLLTVYVDDALLMGPVDLFAKVAQLLRKEY
ncbi:polyprotein [Phytophthora megakarya]|uniref:Polyprotein n=1 Tax=Phytophthora megakarya TaxID=4795 RepID=A0A225UYK7_9STRA|nr:polyprotein [Phytophthora megakarya]